MSDEAFHEWLHALARRHGSASRASGAEQGAGASGGPQAMREQNARLQAQLEERRGRAQQEVASLRAQGFDARLRENPDGSVVVLGARDRIPASATEDATAEALDAECDRLLERARRAVDELQTGVRRAEQVDLQDRLAALEGERADAAERGDASETRRVITDLRELLADAQARAREIDRDTGDTIDALAEGRFEDGPAADEGPSGARPGARPSAGADAGFEALQGEAQELFERARTTLEGLRGRLADAEWREHAARLNTVSGRVNAPANRSSAPEMRRVALDLYAALSDLERRAREVARSSAPVAGGGAEGEGEDARGHASARADAGFEALDGEARGLHRQAGELYERLAERVDEAERRDLRERINAFNGRIRAPANRGDAEEMRRVITDLRALLEDFRARLREG